MDNDILKELENLIQASANKRQSFIIAITKSSRHISEGANNWYCSEVDLLQKEMSILKNVMPEEVSDWNVRLQGISHRFQRALSYLNKIVEQAEKGKITSIGEVHPPKPEIEEIKFLPIISKEKEEEKELNLVSAILEVFDSATDLEKLIKEVEKESKRTIYTAMLVIKAIQKR